MSGDTSPSDGVPDRDELLGGLMALQSVVAVVRDSIARGVTLPSSPDAVAAEAAWTERAALLSLLATSQWHGEAMHLLAWSTCPFATAAHLRPIVEAWLRIETIVADGFTPDVASDTADTTARRQQRLAHVTDHEWRDDLVAAWEYADDALPYRFDASVSPTQRVQVSTREPASGLCNHVAFLASRVIARSWALSFGPLGLPIVPASVWADPDSLR